MHVGAHGAEIAQVAVTADATAAVTADRRGALRLWPTLDGTREPVVLGGPSPIQLAVTRVPGGFLVALLDPANTVTLVTVAASGDVVRRVTVGGDVREIHALARGVILAVHADESIGIWDASGARLARLPAGPGQHIAEVAVHGDRALAILVSARGPSGRWIDGLAWGRETAYAMLLHDVVLGPGALAAGQAAARGSVAFDPDAGSSPKVVCLFGAKDGPPPVVLGFVAEKTIACGVSGALAWSTVDGKTGPLHIELPIHGNAATAIAGDTIVIARGESLALTKADESVHFLGYADIVPPSPSLSPLAAPTHISAMLAPLEGSRAYDPVTQLVADIAGGDVTVARYDAAARRIGHGATLSLPKIAKGVDAAVYLVDPAHAKGVAIVAVTHELGQLSQHVAEFSAAELAGSGDTVTPSRTYLVHDSVRFVDRAGRLVIGDGTEVSAVDAEGSTRYLLQVGEHAAVAESDDGTHVLAFEANRTTMYETRTSKVVWQVGEVGALAARFLPDGDVELEVGAGALVVLDGATGATRARTCGWHFGLYDASPPEATDPDGLSACDVAE